MLIIYWRILCRHISKSTDLVVLIFSSVGFRGGGGVNYSCGLIGKGSTNLI